MSSSLKSGGKHARCDVLKRAQAALGFLMLFLFFFGIAGRGFSPVSVDAAVVGDIGVHGLRSITSAELLDLLGLQKGQPIDADSVRSGIKRAFLKGVFEDIAVDVSDNDPAEVVVRVQEHVRIRKVLIEGDYDVSRKLLLDLLPLKQGQVMRYDLIDRSAEELKEKLAYYGFPQSVVVLKPEQTSDPYEMRLIAHVETGAPLIIRDILLPGEGKEMTDALRIGAGTGMTRKDWTMSLSACARV